MGISPVDKAALVVIIAVSVAFILALLLYGLIESVKQQRQDVNYAFARLAKRFNGELIEGGFTKLPQVVFRHAGVDVVVEQPLGGNTDGNVYTQVRIDWFDDQLRCEVIPRYLGIGIRQLLGVKEIATDSAEFNKKFHICGSHPDVIRRLLSSRVRSLIHELCRVEYDNYVYVAFQSGRLLIKKPGAMDLFRSLEKFVSLSLKLHDQAMLAGGGGIEFVDGHPVRAEGRPICQICGEVMASEIVYCNTCQTPHHQECWEYFGSCSTFGCGDKAFVNRLDRMSRNQR